MKTKDQCLKDAANIHMNNWNLSGFSKSFKHLYQTIIAAMDDYADKSVENALTAQAKDYEELISQIRTSVAEYMRTEGCSCCQDIDGHKEAESRLGELLNAPKYSDDSGYDFSQFRNQKPWGSASNRN